MNPNLARVLGDAFLTHKENAAGLVMEARQSRFAEHLARYGRHPAQVAKAAAGARYREDPTEANLIGWEEAILQASLRTGVGLQQQICATIRELQRAYFVEAVLPWFRPIFERFMVAAEMNAATVRAEEGERVLSATGAPMTTAGDIVAGAETIVTAARVLGETVGFRKVVADLGNDTDGRKMTREYPAVISPASDHLQTPAKLLERLGLSLSTI